MALMRRDHATVWRAAPESKPEGLTSDARAVLGALRARGALFFHELAAATGILRTQVERALGELAGAGLVTADSFSGLRALLTPSEKRRSLSGRASARRSAYGVDTAGRWALLAGPDPAASDTPSDRPEALPRLGHSPARTRAGMSIEAPAQPLPLSVRAKGDNSPSASGQGEDEGRTEAIARILLKRYGIVFRSLLARESGLPVWRDLASVFRRLEARGEIRGGRFVSGFGGEQFALPDAVGRLRAVRKLEKAGELIALSAADPLNLVGILTPDSRVPAIARNRVLFRDGLAIASFEGGDVRRLADSGLDEETLRGLLVRRSIARGALSHLRGPTRRELELLQKNRRSAAAGDRIHEEAERQTEISHR
jgi:ATP-dependent Lhr-like helicase